MIYVCYAIPFWHNFVKTLFYVHPKVVDQYGLSFDRQTGLLLFPGTCNNCYKNSNLQLYLLVG